MRIQLHRRASTSTLRLNPRIDAVGKVTCNRKIHVRCETEPPSNYNACRVNGKLGIPGLILHVHVDPGGPPGPIDVADFRPRDVFDDPQTAALFDPPAYHFGILDFVPGSIEYKREACIEATLILDTGLFTEIWTILQSGWNISNLSLHATGSALRNMAASLPDYDWNWEVDTDRPERASLIITELNISFSTP